MKNLITGYLFLAVCLMYPSFIKAQETPLLDRDLFFGNPEISSGQLSPDGTWISFMKEYEGIMNIWVKRFDEPFENARPLTDSKRPLYGYFWSYDGAYILYVKDKDGDENINVFAVDPSLASSDGKVPESRNLTPLEDVTAQIYSISRNNPDLMMIGLNDRDKAWHDLYRLNISTGDLELVYENKDRITGYNFDWDDEMRILSRTDEQGNTIMLYYKDGELSPIYDFNVQEQAYISGWNEDNSKFYLISNKGDLNFSTLFLMDPETKSKNKIESDPERKLDFGSLRLDANTRKIISTSYTDDKTRIYWKNKTWEDNYKYLLKKFPGREVSFQSQTLDYSKFLVAVWGDKYASESYFFDAKSRELIHQYTPRPKLKEIEEHLVKMQPIQYKSSDGLEIPAYLTLPAGKKKKNLALIVLVHGGPKGPRDYWGYDSEVQFLANRGYAVLQPNFRSSGGYGKDFLNAGDMQWGKLMQDDITWGVKHLIKEGIADEKRIAIMGASYGGYATLAGLAFTPDLYTCGVNIVGISNIFTILESIPPYWEAARAFLYGMVGDPGTEEGKKAIKAASPLFSADKINKPLLIIQGANDPRVKKQEADQIVIALREKGKPVTYLLADDEGHGFAKPVNKMAMYAETEKFLSAHLGGRYQKEVPKDIAARLEELRVDIQSVTYTPKEKVESSKELPELVGAFKVGKKSYDLKLEVQGQEIPMTIESSIEKSEDKWIVKEITSSAMGGGSDEIHFDAQLQPFKRNLNQGGQSFEMNYAVDKITLAAMGQQFEIAMDGAYLSDGPGFLSLIAALPLKDGYSLVFSMPDMNSMKAKQMTLKVEGKEKWNDNDFWKVSVTNNENENDHIQIWIHPENKEAVKMIQKVPAMGNAVITRTLKS